MIRITDGQEMKISVNSVDPLIVAKNKTIRYVDPNAVNTVDVKVTGLARDLMANSQNTYKYTKGTIDLGVFSET